MNIIKIFFLVYLSFFLTSCGTVREAFTNPKKNSSDEFLVEKKSPLTMPPDFNELPAPLNNENTDKNEETKIKDLISNNGESENKNINDSNKNFENILLEKIKKN